jgi:hypothetical protein
LKGLSACPKDSGRTGAVSNLKAKLQLPDHSNAVQPAGRKERVDMKTVDRKGRAESQGVQECGSMLFLKVVYLDLGKVWLTITNTTLNRLIMC